MTFIADLIVALFYIFTFSASVIVIVLFSIVGYAEVKGYIEELKQDRRDAQILRNAEEFRDDFS